MREILFRGKRGDGKWIYGNLLLHKSAKGICGINTLKEIGRVIPETVGQYTGLSDKNGNNIFDGDIVICKKWLGGNWVDYVTEIGFVEFKHGAFGLHRKNERVDAYYRPFKDWLEDYEYEIIGNIHDNPELLKGGVE